MVLISVTGHVVIASICKNLFLTYFSLLPSASTLADYGSLPSRVIQTFIPEESGPLVVLF